MYNKRFEATSDRVRSLTPKMHYGNAKEHISRAMDQVQKNIQSANKASKMGCCLNDPSPTKNKTRKDTLERRMIENFEEIAKSTKGIKMQRINNKMLESNYGQSHSFLSMGTNYLTKMTGVNPKGKNRTQKKRLLFSGISLGETKD